MTRTLPAEKRKGILSNGGRINREGRFSSIVMLEKNMIACR
jgi:hypothetical protein